MATRANILIPRGADGKGTAIYVHYGAVGDVMPTLSKMSESELVKAAGGHGIRGFNYTGRDGKRSRISLFDGADANSADTWEFDLDDILDSGGRGHFTLGEIEYFYMHDGSQWVHWSSEEDFDGYDDMKAARAFFAAIERRFGKAAVRESREWECKGCGQYGADVEWCRGRMLCPFCRKPAAPSIFESESDRDHRLPLDNTPMARARENHMLAVSRMETDNKAMADHLGYDMGIHKDGGLYLIHRKADFDEEPMRFNGINATWSMNIFLGKEMRMAERAAKARRERAGMRESADSDMRRSVFAAEFLKILWTLPDDDEHGKLKDRVTALVDDGLVGVWNAPERDWQKLGKALGHGHNPGSRRTLSHGYLMIALADALWECRMNERMEMASDLIMKIPGNPSLRKRVRSLLGESKSSKSKGDGGTVKIMGPKEIEEQERKRKKMWSRTEMVGGD